MVRAEGGYMVFDKGVLRGKEVVPPDNEDAWVEQICTNSPKRIVAQTWLGGFRISTVFLGLNHQHGDDLPLWFETMVFDDRAVNSKSSLDQYQTRYTTWDEAFAGHVEHVGYVSEYLETGDWAADKTANSFVLD